MTTEFPPVEPPNEAVAREAEVRQSVLTKPVGSLGRLEELGNWVAACQGVCPPKPFVRPRVVVFAGDHGVARHGVSAFPSEVTGQMVQNFLTGGAAVNVLAQVAGATVRVVDMSVDGDTPVGDLKVRRSSGSIDREDAMTREECEAAIAAGRQVADEEVDGGADVLVAGDMGIGNTTPSAVLIASLTGSEPVAVVGRGTGIDDQAWMRKTAAIRDALRRARLTISDPIALLATASGPDIAAMAGFLAQAAVRRTPVVLDGVVVGAAAVVAEELAPGAREWWVAGHQSAEPAHAIALAHLSLKPLLEFDMRLGEGSGAVAALPLLTAATKLLAEMATFDSAGVSGKAGAAEAEAAPEAEARADAGPGAEAGAGTNAATGTGTGTGTGTNAATAAGAEAEAGPDAEAGPRAGAGAETNAATGTGAGTSAGAAAGPGAAADAEQQSGDADRD